MPLQAGSAPSGGRDPWQPGAGGVLVQLVGRVGRAAESGATWNLLLGSVHQMVGLEMKVVWSGCHPRWRAEAMKSCLSLKTYKWYKCTCNCNGQNKKGWNLKYLLIIMHFKCTLRIYIYFTCQYKMKYFWLNLTCIINWLYYFLSKHNFQLLIFRFQIKIV